MIGRRGGETGRAGAPKGVRWVSVPEHEARGGPDPGAAQRASWRSCPAKTALRCSRWPGTANRGHRPGAAGRSSRSSSSSSPWPKPRPRCRSWSSCSRARCSRRWTSPPGAWPDGRQVTGNSWWRSTLRTSRPAPSKTCTRFETGWSSWAGQRGPQPVPPRTLGRPAAGTGPGRGPAPRRVLGSVLESRCPLRARSDRWLARDRQRPQGPGCPSGRRAPGDHRMGPKARPHPGARLSLTQLRAPRRARPEVAAREVLGESMPRHPAAAALRDRRRSEAASMLFAPFRCSCVLAPGWRRLDRSWFGSCTAQRFDVVVRDLMSERVRRSERMGPGLSARTRARVHRGAGERGGRTSASSGARGPGFVACRAPSDRAPSRAFVGRSSVPHGEPLVVDPAKRRSRLPTKSKSGSGRCASGG